MARARAELVIVTGMTGAGRSTAAKELEDLGYYVVDNMPPSLLREVVRLVDESRGTEQPIAVKSEGLLQILHDSSQYRHRPFRIGIFDMTFNAGANGAREIGQYAAGAPGAKFKPDRIGPVRVDRIGNNRLAASQFLRLGRHEQVRTLQFLNDIGDRLRRQRLIHRRPLIGVPRRSWWRRALR